MNQHKMNLSKNMRKILLFSILGLSSGAVLAIASVKNPIATKENIVNKAIIIGDLGGVPVNLLNKVVRLVEYDGDPDWGEARKGKLPTRTYQSKINSLGFDIRYTDGLFSQQSNEYDQQKNLSNSPWVSVGINAGNRYYGAGGINRLGEGKLHPNDEVLPFDQYVKLPNRQYGLEVYAPSGIDPKTHTPWRENLYAEDIFIKRNKSGEIVTYIECSNRNMPHPPCTHYFDLEPDMKLDVYVNYSRYVLADWQKIEKSVKTTIKGFRKST